MTLTAEASRQIGSPKKLTFVVRDKYSELVCFARLNLQTQLPAPRRGLEIGGEGLGRGSRFQEREPRLRRTRRAFAGNDLFRK